MRRSRGARGYIESQTGGFENYEHARATVTTNGTTNVTALAAPPEGVSYRLYMLNGINNSGAARNLWGRIFDETASTNQITFGATCNNNQAFVRSRQDTDSLAEYPTIAILDDTDQRYEVRLSGTGATVITACYEIVDKTGARSFRDNLVALNGTTDVKILDAPPKGEVYRILNIVSYNNSGAARLYYVTVTTNSPEELVAELYAVATTVLRPHTAAHQSPFPHIILSETTDDLYMRASGTATHKVNVLYEVLQKGVA